MKFKWIDTYTSSEKNDNLSLVDTFLQIWKNEYKILSNSYIEWHSLKSNDKTIAIIPWVISIASLIEHFHLNIPSFEVSFNNILQPEDKVNFCNKENEYSILKNWEKVVILKEFSWEIQNIDLPYIQKNSQNLYNLITTQYPLETKNIGIIKVHTTWEIFQTGKFRLVESNVTTYCQKINEINKDDIIIWKWLFKQDYPLSFIIEMAAQIWSLSAARILDPNNDIKGKILTMWNTKFRLLKLPETNQEMHFMLKVIDIDRRNITIIFEAYQSKSKIAIWEISWKIVMKKFLLR